MVRRLNKNLRRSRLNKNLRHRSTNKGFALPLAIGMGLIILLIAATMVIRSQGDQNRAIAQKGTAQALAIAEGGIARTLSSMNTDTNAYLLKESYDPVNNNTNKTYLGPDQVQNNGDEEATAVNTWGRPTPTANCPIADRTIPNGILGAYSIGSGTYQMRSYRYDSTRGLGALLVEGIQGSSESRVQVSLPLHDKLKTTNSFPGLYATNSMDLGNNDVIRVVDETGNNANVICKGCTIPSPGSSSQCVNGEPTQYGLNQALGRGPNSEIDGETYIADPKVPAVPTPPASTSCSTTGSACQISMGSLNLGALIDPAATLPRASDVANHKAGTPYNDVFTDIPLGNNVLTINSTGDPVRFFVSGNITLNGNGGIFHNGDPNRFMIFGNPADPTDSVTDQQFTLSGGSQATKVFVFAPDATMGINGGSQDPDILGAVWVKNWGLSSSNNAEIRVPDNMRQLVTAALGADFANVGIQVNATSASSSWQRQEVQ